MRQLLAYEAGIDAAGSNDIYDLYLVYIGDNEVQLLIYMKLLFTFAGGWTDAESAKFVQDWRVAVATAWTAKRYAKYKDIFISIHVSFDIKIGTSYPGSHWQIKVDKLPAGTTSRTSYVWRDKVGNGYDVLLDDHDFDQKKTIGDGKQTGAVHEFGHMIGLGDEYTADASAIVKGDKNSIMNEGTGVRPRHYESVLHWARKKLPDAMDKIDELNKPKLDDRNMVKPPGQVYSATM